MSRIGEIDTRRPLRRNGDGADRHIETALLQTAKDGLHVGNRDQVERPFHLLRYPPPQIDADPGHRAVAFHVTVRRYVIDSDAQRFGLVLCGGPSGDACWGWA